MADGKEKRPPLPATFEAIADAARSRALEVCERWCPGGAVRGHEYVPPNPRRSGDRPGSFTINLNSGVWADFATGDKGGDLVGLVAYVDGIGNYEAAQALCTFLGIASGATERPPRRRERSARPWAPIVPVPDDAPAPPVRHFRHGAPVARWCYRSRAGVALWVYRFEVDAGKEILPATYCTGPGNRREWRWQGLPAPRPLYRLDALEAEPTRPVLVVEGEKTADAAAELFPARIATTMLNGAQSPGKADWSPLDGRDVLLWPDADAPGRACMAKVAELATAAGAATVRVLDPGRLRPDAPAGWDAADALAEGIARERIDAWAATAEPPGEASKARPAAKSGADAAELGGVQVPAGFKLELSRGVFYRGDGGDGGDAWRWICAPLEVQAFTRNEHGDDWGRLLRFNDPEGREHRFALPARMLQGDGSEYRQVLADMGLAIAPGPAARGKLTEYLARCNPGVYARCVDRCGWHDGAYVLPDRTLGEGAEPIIFQSSSGMRHALAQRGTLEGWRDRVAKLCTGNSRLMFAVSAGFASIALQLVAMESGGFHLRGDSSTGKTTALRVAASVFGGSDYLQRWRATDNGLEFLAARHSGQLLVLDELAQMDAKAAGESAYMLANGAGKSRANRTGGLREPVTWALLILSSGEIGLAEHLGEANRRARAGQEVRLLDVPADAGAGLGIFEDLHNYADGDAFARGLDRACGEHYGTPALAFVDALLGEAEKVRRWWEMFRGRFVAEHLPAEASGQASRAALRFALVAFGGELATERGLTGWERGTASAAAGACLRAWIGQRGGTGKAEDAALFEAVSMFFALHGEGRFADPNRNGENHAPRTLNRAGYKYSQDDAYYVHATVWTRDVLKGHDARRSNRLLADCGVLERAADGKYSHAISARVGMQGGRYYKVNPERIDFDADGTAA